MSPGSCAECCPDCGGEVWQRYYAGSGAVCCPDCGGETWQRFNLLCPPSRPHDGQGVYHLMRNLLLHSVFPRDISRIQTAVWTSLHGRSCGHPWQTNQRAASSNGEMKGGGPSLWRDHSAHKRVRPTSWGIWVFPASLRSWIFLVLFWTMRRCLATRCVPFMTSFSHSYVLGGSQHAFPNFLGRLPFV